MKLRTVFGEVLHDDRRDIRGNWSWLIREVVRILHLVLNHRNWLIEQGGKLWDQGWIALRLVERQCDLVVHPIGDKWHTISVNDDAAMGGDDHVTCCVDRHCLRERRRLHDLQGPEPVGKSGQHHQRKRTQYPDPHVGPRRNVLGTRRRLINQVSPTTSRAEPHSVDEVTESKSSATAHHAGCAFSDVPNPSRPPAHRSMPTTGMASKAFVKATTATMARSGA